MDSWNSSHTSKSMPFSVEFGGFPVTPESPLSSFSSESQASKLTASIKEAEDEELFLEDNVVSPIDLESSIQAERITKILNNTIYKIKLAICIPHLINNSAIEDILHAEKLRNIRQVVKEYDATMASNAFENVHSIMEELQKNNCVIRERLHPELALMLYILNCHSELEPIVNDTILKMKDDYIFNKTEPSNPEVEFLLLIEQFRDMMLILLQRSAKEVLSSKLKVKKLEASNEMYLQNIQEYEKALRDEKENAEAILGMKNNIVQKLQEERLMLDIMADIKLHQIREDTDYLMVMQSRQHNVRSEYLQVENDLAKLQYENCLKFNIDLEKKHRLRRLKCETQLKSWIEKYDADMTDKQTELDELSQLYDEEASKVEVLEERLAEQDKEYYKLMTEREEEYDQEMTQKMAEFQREHAVRIIQNAWRNVLANRDEKKKLRKLIKKKEQEEEAALLKAERKKRQEKAKAALEEKLAKAAKKAAKRRK